MCQIGPVSGSHGGPQRERVHVDAFEPSDGALQPASQQRVATRAIDVEEIRLRAYESLQDQQHAQSVVAPERVACVSSLLQSVRQTIPFAAWPSFTPSRD
jgi:hypothetical protein